jgi:hypothetical protein
VERSKYEKMTKADIVNAAAAAYGLVLPSKMARAKMIEKILDAGKTRPVRKTAPAARRNSPPAKKAIPADEAAERGRRKAKKLSAAFSEWKAEISTSNNLAEITLIRGDETVQIQWDGGVFVYESANYVHGDRVVKIRNVSHAKQLMARSSEQAQEDSERAVENRNRVRSNPPKREAGRLPRRRLRFDPESMSDEEIVDALLGKGVTWLNRITGTTEVAYVGRDPKRILISELDDERVIHWCCPVTGFRSMRLAALLRVSAKVDIRTSEASPDRRRAAKPLGKKMRFRKRAA